MTYQTKARSYLLNFDWLRVRKSNFPLPLFLYCAPAVFSFSALCLGSSGVWNKTNNLFISSKDLYDHWVM